MVSIIDSKSNDTFDWFVEGLGWKMVLCIGQIILDFYGLSRGLCDEYIRLASHMFVTCSLSANMWYKIFRWLRRIVVLPKNILVLFGFFSPILEHTHLRV